MHKDIHFISADEAVKVVKSGDHIHFSSVAAAPRVLIDYTICIPREQLPTPTPSMKESSSTRRSS